jgi:hypothetical protein
MISGIICVCIFWVDKKKKEEDLSPIFLSYNFSSHKAESQIYNPPHHQP